MMQTAVRDVENRTTACATDAVAQGLSKRKSTGRKQREHRCARERGQPACGSVARFTPQSICLGHFVSSSACRRTDLTPRETSIRSAAGRNDGARRHDHPRCFSNEPTDPDALRWLCNRQSPAAISGRPFTARSADIRRTSSAFCRDVSAAIGGPFAAAFLWPATFRAWLHRPMTATRGVTDGLYLGEVVLLVLGVVLFAVLIVAFVYQLRRQRSLKSLIAFFLVSIVMIVYPSIRSIQYKDGAITLEKMTRELNENPTDVKLREALDEKIKDVAPRVANSPKDAVKLARAQFDLGREDEAARSLERVPPSNADLPEVRELRTHIDQVDRLRSLANKVEANPGDQQSRGELQRTLAAADQVKWANPNALAVVSKAQSALGEHTKAEAAIEKAIRIAPNNPKIRRQRDSLVRNAQP